MRTAHYLMACFTVAALFVGCLGLNAVAYHLWAGSFASDPDVLESHRGAAGWSLAGVAALLIANVAGWQFVVRRRRDAIRMDRDDSNASRP